jgi:hypothetical protein
MAAMDSTRRGADRRCGICGSPEVVPVLYGYPSPQAFEDAAAGRIALGGCVIFEGRTVECCKACGAERREGDGWVARKPPPDDDRAAP